MAFDVITYVSAVEILSLVVALVLVVLAFGGYRKTKSKAMLSAALGFGMLGVASLVEGILYSGLGVPWRTRMPSGQR